MEELNKFIRNIFDVIDKDMIRIQKEIDAKKEELNKKAS